MVRQNVAVAFKSIDKLIALLKTPFLPQVTRPRTEKIKEYPQKGKKTVAFDTKGLPEIAHFGDKYRNNKMNWIKHKFAMPGKKEKKTCEVWCERVTWKSTFWRQI